MTIYSVKNVSPEEIGMFVQSEFIDGEKVVHLRDVPLFNKTDLPSREFGSSDGLAFQPSYKIQRNMLRICQNIGNFQSASVDPMSFIELNNKAVPPIMRYHTAEASQPDPARIVSYWDAQPLRSQRKDSLKLVTIDRMLQWASESPERQERLEALKEPHLFIGNGMAYAPMLDMKAETVRYDRNSFSIPAPLADGEKPAPEHVRLELAHQFFRLLDMDESVAKTVKILPGDAVFIDNDKVLHAHAEQPKLNQSRLMYRILLHSPLEPVAERPQNDTLTVAS